MLLAYFQRPDTLPVTQPSVKALKALTTGNHHWPYPLLIHQLPTKQKGRKIQLSKATARNGEKMMK